MKSVAPQNKIHTDSVIWKNWLLLFSWLTASHSEKDALVAKFQIYQPTWLKILARIASFGSDEEFYLLCFAVFVWGPDCNGGFRHAFALGLHLGLCLGLGSTIKNIFRIHRPRNVWKPFTGPSQYEFSFPSTHAMMSVCFSVHYSFQKLFYDNHIQNPYAILFAILFILCWSLPISFSRVYLGVHSFQDIFVGWIIGIIIGPFIELVIVNFLWNKLLYNDHFTGWMWCFLALSMLIFWMYLHPIGREDKVDFLLSEGTFDYSPPIFGLAFGICLCTMLVPTEAMLTSAYCRSVDDLPLLLKKYAYGVPVCLSILLGAPYFLPSIIEPIVKYLKIDAHFIHPTKYKSYLLTSLTDPNLNLNPEYKISWVRVWTKFIQYILMSLSVLILSYE